MPPVWCSLPGDRDLYPRPQPFEGDPGVIKLEDSSRCTCGSEYTPTAPSFHGKCTIYGLTRAVETRIELQHCRVCNPRQRQYIGPDGREMGLFNWSNQVLFTHELLDEYTCAFTTSETPFAAWVLVISSRYETAGSGYPFVSVGLFRSVWFAFVGLQAFENDMSCTICGPSPKHIIWDGVTVAFSRKKLLPSLRPPTTTSTNSPKRNNIRYNPAQRLIPDRETRQLILKALVSRRQVGDQEEPTLGEIEGDATAREEAFVELTKVVEEKLKGLNEGLCTVFAQKFGPERKSVMPTPAYFELFRQVSILHFYQHNI